MKIYIAAPWPLKHLAETLAFVLEGRGHTITRDWWNHEVGIYSKAECAEADRQGVENCDCVICVSGVGSSGGKHTEFGLGMAYGKRLIIFGEEEQIFHYHFSVELYSDLGELLNALY